MLVCFSRFISFLEPTITATTTRNVAERATPVAPAAPNPVELVLVMFLISDCVVGAKVDKSNVFVGAAVVGNEVSTKPSKVVGDGVGTPVGAAVVG